MAVVRPSLLKSAGAERESENDAGALPSLSVKCKIDDEAEDLARPGAASSSLRGRDLLDRLTGDGNEEAGATFGPFRARHDLRPPRYEL